MRSYQKYFLDVISQKSNNPFSKLFRAFLHLPTWIFKGIIVSRNWAYDKGYFKIHKSEAPLVISIGNIVVGGTGKTPTTLLLAQTLNKGKECAILTRGYRSRAETLPTPLILSRGKGPLYGASYCGDEPYLLARRLPKVTVIVGKDRSTASQMAVEAGAKILLLDDGMQHRSLHRHIDVVVIDANNPFGHGHLMPRGLLREPVHALSRAHFIVLTHIRDVQHYEETHSLLRAYTNAPMIGTHLELNHIWHTHKGKLHDLKQKRLALFCGIAHPDRFMKTVQALGAQVVTHKYFPDHCQFDLFTLQSFANEAMKKGAEALICTEKDYVKLKGCFHHSLPLIWLEMKTVVTFGEDHWKTFISEIKSKF